MASKRLRSNVDVVGGINELLNLSVRSPSHGEERLDTQSFSGQPNWSLQVTETDDMHSTPLKRLRTSESPAGVSSRSPSSASPSSLRTTSDSIGGDELDLLRRKDEEVADMALFLAKAVGETSSRHSLAELVGLLVRSGVSRVALALKRVGGQTTFMGNLHEATSFTDNERRIAIVLFSSLMAHVDAEALLQKCVVTFLVKSLTSANTQEASPALDHRIASHWSARGKQKGAVPQPSSGSSRGVAGGLEGQVARLCGDAAGSSGSYEDKSCASLALRSLLTIMFVYNSSPHMAASRHLSVPLLFANAGGLQHLGKLLSDRDTQEHALALLEVLTATEELSLQNDGLLALVPALVAQLRTSAVEVPVLKVLTNITNILPHALSATGTAAAFAQFALETLLRPRAVSTPDEIEIFVLCCAINVVKYESKETESPEGELAEALVASQDTLMSLAGAMVESYRCSSTEQLVRSGYYALLLGALSLVPVAKEEGSTTLRVLVMTAVARVSDGHSIGLTAGHQPMRIVVAIIQEFLFFQSSAGTLTKEVLQDMKALVDRILRSNHIDVASDGDRRATTADSITAVSTDEDDDLVLGQLL
ncbi:conserved hypothetical protein [Leishmania major strain Friedlin]|uniref:Wings apart-like protein C-terminal domain-containing protein n=1 Tax=Leishmania major TaxID=5664 RepID=Q4Q2B6_LEIMA|nr:conserved hypothetical protein [Leishmania major strain Friedlin]CAG9582307.1 hypothetical_protein_-_conserved [Leishmania major strain Friedlin]CAJ08158.1 conserved hypothetical protein [Leishmania major strain Friedlin]|eukprot:XP_001686532.1 conserved hypothetical protein [Leishmania major strain Friedlin]